MFDIDRRMRLAQLVLWTALGAVFGCTGSGAGDTDSLAVDPATLAEDPLVPIREVAPRIRIDARYATADNFTGRALYSSNILLLRFSVAERLMRVADRLAAEGHTLIVWDAYRPLSVQETMWSLVPDERYVANPAKGSKHNRGAAVDVTLGDRSGNALELPTRHDDFTERAHRDSIANATAEARRHYEILDAAMRAEGFIGLPTEWWHYDDPNWEHFPIVGR